MNFLKTQKVDVGTYEERDEAALTPLGYIAIILGMVIVIMLICVVLSIKTIIPGEAAVAVKFGELNGVRNEGVHLALFEGYTIYNLKTNKLEGEHETGSSDGQFIYVDTAFTYTLKSDKLPELYSKVGTQLDLENKFIIPVIRDITYQVAAGYATDEILPKQGEFRSQILEEIKVRMNQDYINVVDLQITDIDFKPEYNTVLEQKQIAEQNAIKDRQVAEQDLERKKVELESTRIEAEKQKLLIQSLTPELLQKMWIEKWNGTLPTTVAGDSDVLLPLK